MQVCLRSKISGHLGERSVVSLITPKVLKEARRCELVLRDSFPFRWSASEVQAKWPVSAHTHRHSCWTDSKSFENPQLVWTGMWNLQRRSNGERQTNRARMRTATHGPDEGRLDLQKSVLISRRQKFCESATARPYTMAMWNGDNAYRTLDLFLLRGVQTNTTLAKKKEPSSRIAARRTLFHVWYHARSRAISAGQKSRTVADRTLPCADRLWSSMISHVEQRSSRRKSQGWFFFLARVVRYFASVLKLAAAVARRIVTCTCVRLLPPFFHCPLIASGHVMQGAGVPSIKDQLGIWERDLLWVWSHRKFWKKRDASACAC